MMNFEEGFLNCDTIDILGNFFGACPVHCRLFTRISGLRPLNASSLALVVTADKSRTLLNVPWEGSETGPGGEPLLQGH